MISWLLSWFRPVPVLTRNNQADPNECFYVKPVVVLRKNGGPTDFQVFDGATKRRIQFENVTASQWHFVQNPATGKARLGIVLDEVPVAILEEPTEE